MKVFSTLKQAASKKTLASTSFLVTCIMLLSGVAKAQNPLASAQNFNIFTEGNFSITAGDIEGSMAVGGNLIVLGNAQRTSANNTGGIGYTTISGTNYALIVGGGLSGVNGGNVFKVDGKAGSTTDHYIRFNTLSGSTAADNGGGIDIGNPVTNNLNRYIRVNSTTQTASTVANATSIVNFAAAYTDFRNQATIISGCTNNVTTSVVGGQATLTLGANATNVWNVTGTTLNSYSQINLTGNLPSATRPLVINVNAAGTFNWNNLKFIMGSESDNFMEINRAPYIIWNFYNTTTLTIANANLILGSILAPNAATTNNASGNITGQVIVKNYTKPNAGEFHIAKFNANITCAASNNCSCPGNLVVNPSFESGTTGWDWSGGTLSTGTGAVACGSFSGDFQITNTTNNWVSQTIGTDLAVGTVINAKVYAGTHDNTFYQSVQISFFDANWNWISGSEVEVNKILANAPAGPQLYTWSGVVPPNTKYTQVGFSGNGNWIKTDQWCVTLAPATTVSFGNEVFVDTNGDGIKNGGDWGYDGVTVKLYADNNDDGVADGAALATQTTSGGGFYNFTNLAPGKYFAQLEAIPSWMQLIPKNGGDPDNNIDNDNNGLTKTTTTIKGATVTLSLGGEPNVNYNPTYDFAIYKNNGLGDYVFLDANNNGIQDAGESGINGVTVNLKNTAGTTLATTTTDATGYYYFYDPAQYGTNTYNIQFITPAGYTPSPSNQGADDSKDSDPIGGIISNVTVPIGTWNYTLDAGFSQAILNVGNFVWYDKNNNGTQDAGEPGISGATVKLYVDANGDNTPDGAATATTTTVANGLYNFGALTPNKYIVGVTLPAGYAAAATTATSTSPDNDNNTDNNGVTTVSGELRSNFITLSAGTEPTTDGDGNNGNLTLDFGLKGTGSIGNYVWGDANGNSLQDVGEVGISGVLVRLVRAVGDTINTTTDASGAYLFSNLAPSNYTVIFPTLNGYNPSSPNVGADDNIDSDPVNGLVAVALGAGENNLTVDAGYCPTSLSLGDYVWYDKNNNGVQDAGETPMASTTVNLYRDANGDNVPDGAAIATTTTNASGIYNFTNQLPGNYIVGVVIPAGYAASAVSSSTPNNDNNTDNNGVITVSGELRSNFITLIAGAEPTTDGDGNNGNLTLDFGLRGTGSIGDFVFNDLNGNGIQDAGEACIPNATVTLTYPDGSTVSTTTDANGNYLFSNLAPTAAGQTYSVTFTTPAGTVASPSNQGADDSKDSDPVGGVVSGITLTAGQSNLTVDAGFQSNQLNVGNYVWYDKNNNGVQDAGETPIAGATVNLYKDANGDNTPDGAAIATTTTNASGIYNFAGLTPGNYIAGVVIPAGYAASAVSSSTPNNDNNTDNNGVTTVSGELRSNFITLTTTGEPTTDGDGNNGNLTLDFGLRGTGSIGDFVFNDLNGNGIQDAGEAGIPNATVTLTYPDGSTVSTTTDANGNYLFSNLAPTAAGQTYSVTFTTPAGTVASPSNQGADDAKDSDPVGGVVSGITLTAGQSNLTVDAGFQSNQLNVGNYVWYDKNNNGVQDAGETPIAGATVNLYRDANGDNVPDGAAIATTTTNASGIYNFAGLTPGNYIAGVVIPAGYSASAVSSSTPNNDNNTDNNGVTTVSGELRSNFITLTTTGEPTTDGDGNNGNLTLDFGLRGTGSIGDFVFTDLNGNGVQDAGEAGIPNSTVTLTYPDGTTASTTTDANGLYSFTNLAPGNYNVTFGTPSGFTPTGSNLGGDDTKDSDPIGGVVTGIAVNGNANTTIDAGFYQLVNVGNYVWYDRNNNGAQDAGELGVNGLTVKLYKDADADNIPDAAAVVTTTTDASGIYNFGSLAPGNYIVGVVLPSGYTPSLTTTSSLLPNNDNNTDNNAITLIGTEVRSNFITLISNGEPNTAADGDGTNGNLTLDFGVKGLGAIGNFVWNDVNGNGVQDGGEAGIPNATVTLTYPDGATVTTTTDVNGVYAFNNLIPGTYSVTFATPASYTPTGSNLGGNDGTDSDPVGGIVTGIALAAGQTDNSIDAGFYQLVNVGSHVWYDRNNNGTKDAGEPAINAATVKLYADANNDNIADGAALATTTTDATGLYAFNNLAPNNYIVGVTIPTGYAVQTINGGDPDTNTDNDNNGINTSVAGEVRSSAVTLTSGGEPATGVDGDGTNGNLTVDFGFIGTGSIGDFVFTDLNGNGVQDAGEAGIPNATVTLTYPDGTTASTTTDANGLYSFTNLAPGNYNVTFGTPAGFTPTGSNLGGDDTKDSDPIGGVVTGIAVNGNANTTIDAGFYQLLSLGNYVWEDKNNNGLQDAGEAGINGATVNLYKDTNSDNIPDGAAIGTTTTSGGGLYGFGSLVPGNYIVGVVIPAGYVVSSTTATSASPNNDNLTDNNGVTTVSGEVRSNFITLSSAGEPTNDGDGNLANQTLDFGLRSIASLGDKVWRDDDKDGVQDAGEPGVSGVTVSLFDNTGKLVGSVVTDAYGNYLFSNLPAGDYTVGFTLPANYTFSPSTGTSETNATNSDVNPITGNTTTVTLSPGENQLNIDAGIIFNNPPTKANIGDRVWLDTDKDGIQDAGEPGIAGVTVTLFDNTGAIVATAVTDANGNYLFTDVTPGTGYTIGFTAPAGTVFSPKDATTDTNDSDADPLTGKTAPFTVVAGTTDLSFDAGLSPQVSTKASLGDKVWNDLDHDGIQDSNEPGIAGVTVNLYAPNGTTLLGTTKTDAFGNYIFTNLDAGTYIVEFVKPSGYTSSPKDAGTDDAKDSDADITTGKTAPIVLAAGDRNTTVDAGMYLTTPPGNLVLGDKVWNDENKDGVQAATEDGVAGVTVILYQNGVDGLPGTADDVKLKSTSTDVNGNYIFTDLAASTNAATNYNVQFSNLPSGYSFTTQDQTAGGGNDANDSDPNTATGRTASINLTANNLTVDAGIVQGVDAGKGSLGDRVWYDMPGGTTGVQDATEQGVSGVTVKLYKDANNDGTISGAELTAIATTTTNALGNYMFGGLDAGNYQVGFSNLPTGFTLTTKDAGTNDAKDSDGNPLGSAVAGNTATTGTSYTGLVSLAQGEDKLTVDLGIVPPANTNSLGGDVWKDANNDGIQTPGEQPVKGVMVTLYNSNGDPIATTVTDENGKYLFVGLPDGSYSVGFSSLPAGYNFTNQSATNDATGSDANVTTGRTTTVVLGPGNRNDTSLDAGLVTTKAALGNYVWFDGNSNGTQDATESGISGVTVTLTRPGFGLDGTAGNADDALPVATAITDANGGYFFGNLAVGNYVVNFSTIPNNTVFTQQNIPGDNQNNTNSDANPSTGSSALIALSAGETDLTIDAGVKPNLPGAVGDYVWSDVNGNGVQDANEPGVAGVLVTLYDAANNPIGSAITDGNGAYLITNVPAGTGYTIGFSNLPTGAIFTTQTSNVTPTDATLGSDADPVTGRTASFTIVAGETLPTVDAGIRTNILNLGNYVWYDKNNNGTQDATEQGINALAVRLYKDVDADNIPDGAAIATTTTNASGIYNFGSLNPGNYIVGVELPNGYTPSLTTATSVVPNNDNNTDNNAITLIGTEVRSNFITLTANTEPDVAVDSDGTNGNLTLDFGVKGLGAIGNFVWYDLNRNGVQDAGEAGIPNSTVTLTYPDGTTVSTTTDANGAYAFNNLIPGTYSVTFETPAGTMATGSNLGGNDLTDSDPIGGVVSGIALAAGQTDNSIDAGFHNTCSSIIRGNVWHDADGMTDNFVDSVYPTAVTPIPTNLRVSLVSLTTGLVVRNSLVSGTGIFQFSNVPAGSYYIQVSRNAGVVGQLPPPVVLPNGWTYTGEKLGTGPGRDLLVNGILNVTMGYECIGNANFGIKLNNTDIGID